MTQSDSIKLTSLSSDDPYSFGQVAVANAISDILEGTVTFPESRDQVNQ
ncbi:hypothetical protein MUB24_03900 [Lederbergia sp. NSJ-179]|nr:hypothetical protein [Lederbergia sp. NSJ-179]MCJ7840068.1 hypothetical protein [Lederbergia sp. NSJ-179]